MTAIPRKLALVALVAIVFLGAIVVYAPNTLIVRPPASTVLISGWFDAPNYTYGSPVVVRVTAVSTSNLTLGQATVSVKDSNGAILLMKVITVTLQPENYNYTFQAPLVNTILTLYVLGPTAFTVTQRVLSTAVVSSASGGSGGGAPLKASFQWTQIDTTNASAVVVYTANVSGGTAPYSFVWSFGNNDTASGSLVSRTYTKGGVYSVSLTVVDSTGSKVVTTSTVTVILLEGATNSGTSSTPPPAPSSFTLLNYLLIAVGVVATLVGLFVKQVPMTYRYILVLVGTVVFIVGLAFPGL